MNWKVEYTKTFLKELTHLPKEIQKRGEEIAFKELSSENPFDIGYIEQMTGNCSTHPLRSLTI